MEMYNPVTTYRLQFSRDFKLKDAESILPYLNKTGIKTIYASPVMEAVRGSKHGYDVVNPLRINPEIGTNEDFKRLTQKVHDYGMGWIQDIVPNHMAFSAENPWISDVLEKGRDSEYYTYFDIIEDHPDPQLKNKLMLPFFGKSLDELIRDNEISVALTPKGFMLKYFDADYPLSVPAYSKVLKMTGKNSLPEPAVEFLNPEHAVSHFENLKKELFHAYEHSAAFKTFLDECLIKTNSNPENIKEVTESLYYYPSYWRDTESRINYRRFFTINGLICLNIQDEKVFEATHELIKEWLETDMIDGVRVDHIDGLFNPTEYLERLRRMTGDHKVIYVEKILEENETLPAHWQIQGSTGYDFLALVNNLLTNRDTGSLFNSFYSDWNKKSVDFEEVFYKNNRFILYQRLAGELDNLTRLCMKLQSVLKYTDNWQKLRSAIGEFLVACPVYKVYNAPSRFTGHEIGMVVMIGEAAIKKNPGEKHLLKILMDLFLLKLPGSKNESAAVDAFFRRCMQFTGPLMAKGIEDTAFYSYNPFIGHNEVGDSPGYFGIGTDKFHEAMEERLKNMPVTMNALSTHDTKRGEDARARLNVLSDMPVKWIEEAEIWREMNKKYRRRAEDKMIPTANDEYLIYQVLCAHLPMKARTNVSFTERLQQYFIKAIREAKVNSSWSNPNEDYEKEILNFISDILSERSGFPVQLTLFMEELIPHGIVNSLTQVILKNTVPGIPDTFQGTETWNLSFVDPDNRRPVDYLELSKNLEEMEKSYQEDPVALAADLFGNPLSGRIKQWVSWLTLKERSAYPDLFLKGTYQPLKVIGKYHKRVIAFYRGYEQQHMVVILPLSTATLKGDSLWEDTRIRLPEAIPSGLVNRFTGKVTDGENPLELEELFDVVPFAVLRNL